MLTAADAEVGALVASAAVPVESAVTAGAFPAAVGDESDTVVSRAARDFRALETRGLSLPSSALSVGATALRGSCVAVDPAGTALAAASLFGGASAVLACAAALAACGIASGAAAGRVDARAAVGGVAAAGVEPVVPADAEDDDAGAGFLEPKIRLSRPPLAGWGSSVGGAGSGAVSVATRRERAG